MAAAAPGVQSNQIWTVEKPLDSLDFLGAGDGTRTRDSLLGKQVLYQLSYPRIVPLSIRRGDSSVYCWADRARFDQRSPESVYSVGPREGA
jgi:hypothetical protein